MRLRQARLAVTFWIWRVLMTTARTVGGQVHPEIIEEMDRELSKVIEDFDRAVDVEALRLAKETRKHPLYFFGDNKFSAIS